MIGGMELVIIILAIILGPVFFGIFIWIILKSLREFKAGKMEAERELEEWKRKNP